MRALLLTAVVFGMLPFVLLQPQVGVLLYCWISLMNPHRIAWGVAYDFQYALVVALVTIAAWLFSRERKMVPLTAPTILLVLLWLWTSVTTLEALSPASAYLAWETFSKILVMIFITIPMMQSRTRLHALIWVIVGSLGYYGVKGGGFSIVTGGNFRVLGPPDSFIGDNNAIALALDMVLPLMWYLRLNSRSHLIRQGLLAAIGLTALAVVTTYSRGGFLGLAVVAAAALARSRHRFALGLGVVALTAAIQSFLPDQWFSRMSSITGYEADSSAQTRLAMWKMAVEIARDRPFLGGGFKVFVDPTVYPRYNPEMASVHDVHSIYFEMLGEHGVVGLALFLALGIATLWHLTRIRRNTRNRVELRWAYDMASMTFVSVVGYAVSGAFLTLGTFDLYYLLIGVTVALRQTVQEALKHRDLGVANSDAYVSAPWSNTSTSVGSRSGR